MRISVRLSLASFILMGCGGDGGKREAVIPPVLSLETNTRVIELTHESASAKLSHGGPATWTYEWQQVSGPAVVFSSPENSDTSITFPYLDSLDSATIILQVSVSTAGSDTLTQTIEIEFTQHAQRLEDVTFTDENLKTCLNNYFSQMGLFIVPQVESIVCENMGIINTAGLENLTSPRKLILRKI